MNDVNINNPYIEKELQENGYVVIPALEIVLINDFLQSIYKNIKYTNEGKYNYNTGANLPSFERTQVIEKIKNVFTPILEKDFSNFEITMGILFVKRPSPNVSGQIGLHVDPSLLKDEHKQKHLNIWLPLVDVDENNGALWVIPRSHKIFAPVHAVTIPFPFSKIQETVLQFGKCICMKAGEALIFDNRLIHYSLQNFSLVDRPAIVLSFTPPNSEFISFFKAPESNSLIEVYTQPKDWYKDPMWSNSSERPRTGKLVGYLNYDTNFINAQQFTQLIQMDNPTIEYSFELR